MADKKPAPKPKPDAKLTCFIIMPLTTPPGLVADYGGDPDHFLHVLEHLFVPAAEKAGFEAIRPIAKGSDIIQAEIIRHLEQADMVLCDMSILNANVFFELGVRTAVDKPTCMVRDSLTARVPFDTTIINHHEYDASLATWVMEGQIAALAEHLADSAERCAGENKLWSYFGLTKRAETKAPESPLEAKVDAVLAHLTNARAECPPSSLCGSGVFSPGRRAAVLANACAAAAARYGIELSALDAGPGHIMFNTGETEPEAELLRELTDLGRLAGLRVTCRGETPSGVHMYYGTGQAFHSHIQGPSPVPVDEQETA